jgi:hypothetical protein
MTLGRQGGLIRYSIATRTERKVIKNEKTHHYKAYDSFKSINAANNRLMKKSAETFSDGSDVSPKTPNKPLKKAKLGKIGYSFYKKFNAGWFRGHVKSINKETGSELYVWFIYVIATSIRIKLQTNPNPHPNPDPKYAIETLTPTLTLTLNPRVYTSTTVCTFVNLVTLCVPFAKCVGVSTKMETMKSFLFTSCRFWHKENCSGLLKTITIGVK